MKKIIALVLLLAPIMLMAQTNFNIEAKVSGSLISMKKAYLFHSVNDKEVIDSTSIVNGSFSFSGMINDKDVHQYNLSIGNKTRSMSYDMLLKLFPKRGDQIKLDIANVLNRATINGSKESLAYQHFEQQFMLNRKSQNYIDILKPLITQYPDSKMSFTALNYWYNSFNILWIAQYHPDQISQIKELFLLFSARIKNSKDGLAYQNYLDRLSQLSPGGQLQEFISQTLDGKTIQLSDLRGKYVLVDFWASWCEPCVAEFPSLIKTYEKYSNRNFEILGYSIDSQRTNWEGAINREKLPWINVSNLKGNKDPIAQQYGIVSIPTNFLIDPNGKVVAINIHGEKLETTLNQLLSIYK